MNADYLQVGLSKNNSLLIPTTNAVEVISRKRSDICPIPGLLSSLLGVVNQRGRLLWILDLANFLGFAEECDRKLDREEVTIVVLTKERERGLEERQPTIGCLVAGLQEMVSLDEELIEKVDRDLSATSNDFFYGKTITEKLSMPILNIVDLLNYLQYNSAVAE
jgi:twitching motility protein PilI